MILLIEHGQTPLDAQGESHGGRDVGLNRTGRAQAVRLGMRLRQAQPRPEILYHSPRKRAMQTARIAGHVARIPVVEQQELAPLQAGELGQGPEAAAARRLAPYFREPERPIPGGEAVTTWRKRHIGFMRRLAASGRPAAVVTHSNVIGSLRGGLKSALEAFAHPPRPAVAVRFSGSARTAGGPRKQ